jgi:ribosomal protein L11 methyltransferase
MPAVRIDTASDVLFASGAESISIGDAGDAPVLEPGPGEAPLWPDAYVDALFPLDVDLEALRNRLTRELPDVVAQRAPDVRFIADSDWSQTWRQHGVEGCFGERLWLLPRDAPSRRDGIAELRLDPGLAFGTGGHATTAMCLEWLAAHRIDGCSVVDYGCGSGILGLAALRLGAATVVAVDHDPQALLATQANATYNAIESRRVTITEPDRLVSARHDLVIANILAGPLCALAPRLSELVRPGGALVMSGMLVHQVDEVVACYPDFRFAPAHIRDSWAMVEGIRARD